MDLVLINDATTSTQFVGVLALDDLHTGAFAPP